MDGHPIRGLISVLFLLCLNALVAAAEEAFSNVNGGSVEHRAQEGERRAVRLKKLLDTPHYYRNVIEITVTSTSLLAGMLYAFSIYGWIRHLLLPAVSAGEEISVIPLAAAMVFVTVFLIYLMVLFSILVPKKIAGRLGERAAYALAPFILLLYRFLSPVVFLLEKNSNFLLRIFGFSKIKTEENVTEEEIISIVNEGHEQGVLEAGEVEMISNIIEFDEKEAKDVMTHRKRMVAIKADTSIEDALNFMLNEPFSRFPLYGENVDDIIGVLHVKDVMNYYTDGKLRKRPLVEASHRPYFVPDTQDLDVLFRSMQEGKIHMAIVADEYGQTAGLVTMEDILEEIVGDIKDEYDKEEDLIRRDGDGRFVVSGEVSLSELVQETGLKIRKEDEESFDTLNGLLISLLDHIPQDDEVFSVEYEGFCFDSVATKARMIRRVRMRELPPSAESQEGEETEKP